MRIAVNTRLLLKGHLDGIGWFSYETLRRIVAAHPEHEFFFLFDRPYDDSFIFSSNVHPVVLFPPTRHPLLWRLYFGVAVPWALRRLRADLLISPDGWMSLRTNVPTLTVIHDINFEHSTDFLKPSHQRYMTSFFPRFARAATRVATVSAFSKNDIATTYGVDPSRIDVVYNGANDRYKPLTQQERKAICDSYTSGSKYFVFVGTISPRKNLHNILAAYDYFRRSHPSLDHKMLVVGSPYNLYDSLKNVMESMTYRQDVIFTGHVEASTLASLLGAAEALVYASVFEGFGIPIVEAFHAETPVITANVSSMPEVAGDAALLVDPLSVDDIASAMDRIVGDSGLRDTLISRGRQRRALFSWQHSADLLWQSVEMTCRDAGLTM